MINKLQNFLFVKAGVPKLENYLNLAALRHKLKAGNVANASTPGQPTTAKPPTPSVPKTTRRFITRPPFDSRRKSQRSDQPTAHACTILAPFIILSGILAGAG